jgi:TPR repeat protein
MFFRLLNGLLLSALLAHSSFAAQPESVGSRASGGWVDPGWRRSVARYYVKFDEQGLSTTTFDFEYQAVDDKGVAAIAQEVFNYNSYFYDMTATNLVTAKADGTIIPVDEKAVKDQPQSTDASSPYFDERRLKIVAFPNVASGDKVRGHLVFTAKRPEFPGEFAGFWSQNLNEPPEVMELTLDGPESLPVHVVSRGVDTTEEKINGRILFHVKFSHSSPQLLTDEIDGFDSAHRFEVSTFKDYATFAAMLSARNAPMSIPEESVKKTSAEIVGDATTTQAKVERLHNWVAQHIRYVGIGFEDGGWTSQPAAATLNARYGDCKAHATLLKALLAAQGIEANLVAINLSERFTLTELAMPNFDHAIVYVPELDRYLDPTSSLVAFGALPAQLYGKPVLNIDKGVVSSVPVLSPPQFSIETNTDYILQPDGLRHAKSTWSGSGIGASLVRNFAQYAETQDQENFAKQRLQSTDLDGSGKYEIPNPRNLSDSYSLSASFEITSAVALTGWSRVRLTALANGFPSFWDLMSGGKREGVFSCFSIQYKKTASLTLPEGTHVYEIPASLSSSETFNGNTGYGSVTGLAEVSGSTVLDGRTVRSESHFRFTFSAPVCPAEFAKDIKRVLSKFNEFAAGDIVLTPQPVSQVLEKGFGYQEGVAAYQSKNYAEAMDKLLPIAKRGNVTASVYVARMYESGHGVAQDYNEARSWFAKAAAQGDEVAQYDLGRMNQNGLGAPPDYKQAFDWYMKSAAQGDSWAEYNLGFMYGTGQGLTKDYSEALAWYLKAANHGKAMAQGMVGLYYDEAKGIAQDYEQAAQWYRKGADQGDGFAQLRYGLLLAFGRGVPADQKQAVEWYRKAAEQGNSAAQYNLGNAYEKGLGVLQDKVQAMEWYRQAVNGGQTGAQTRLDALSGASQGANSFWSGLSSLLSSASR